MLGLIEALVPDWPGLAKDTNDQVLSDVLTFVRTELGHAPQHIKSTVFVFGALFMLVACVLGRGKGFGHQSLPWRKKYIFRWSNTGHLAYSYIRVIRSLSIFAFLEHPAVRKELGYPSRVEHQAIFRQNRTVPMRAD